MLIVCYEQKRPARIVRLEEKGTIEIPSSKAAEYEASSPSVEDFIKEVTKRSDAYKDYLKSQAEDPADSAS